MPGDPRSRSKAGAIALEVYPGGMARSLFVLCLALLAGCSSTIPADPSPRAPVELHPEVLARFAYTADVASVSLTRDWEDDQVEVFSGLLPVSVPGSAHPGGGEGGLPADDGTFSAKFEYWRSKSAPASAPVVLITPILGGGKTLARWNCYDFANAGFHVVLAWRNTRVLRHYWDLGACERWMRKAIGARRGLVDWIQTRPEMDGERVVAFGASMGGIITTVLLGLEPRLKAGAMALAGGDVPSILSVSSEGRLERYWAAKLEETGLRDTALQQLQRGMFPSDPLAIAPAVDARKVVMVTTWLDTVVPLENQLLLWRALGKPLRYHLPVGHYTAIFYLNGITERVIEFYRERLRAAASPPLARAR